ncbi:TOBE domain-containing protein [Paraburkholderia xenovorans]
MSFTHSARDPFFAGKLNLLDVRAQGGAANGLAAVRTADGAATWHAAFDEARPPAAGEPLLLALRPERIRVGEHLPNRIGGRVQEATYAGDGWLLQIATGASAPMLVKISARAAPAPGDQVTLGWDSADAVLLRDEVVATQPAEPIDVVAA